MLEDKVVAVTVDNASNMDAAAKKLQIQNGGCFAHIFNPAAGKSIQSPFSRRGTQN